MVRVYLMFGNLFHALLLLYEERFLNALLHIAVLILHTPGTEIRNATWRGYRIFRHTSYSVYEFLA